MQGCWICYRFCSPGTIYLVIYIVGLVVKYFMRTSIKSLYTCWSKWLVTIDHMHLEGFSACKCTLLDAFNLVVEIHITHFSHLCSGIKVCGLVFSFSFWFPLLWK